MTRSSPGSSPLARGLPYLGGILLMATGIIPARAGFTPIGSGIRSNRSDHPRSRGVYRRSEPRRHARAGSSPLARGLPSVADAGLVDAGIIPARAGFTSGVRLDHAVVQDHPRSRGVYPPTRPASRPSAGSSPLARGLRRTRPRDPDGPGIIPARAGFTSTTPTRTCLSTDHPRSRGVYAHRQPSIWGSAGSSPLARGLPAWTHAAPDPAGIIPARAGFTPGGRPSRPRRRDHPRSRGVYA